MTCSLVEFLGKKIDWAESLESPYVFQAVVDGWVIKLRLNDFPEEPLCTLMVSDMQLDLDDFPAFWSLPRHRASKA